MMYMKKVLLLFSTVALALCSKAQQIGNGDLEQWENVLATYQEPVNWNSFLTGGGQWASSADNQIESSTDVRPGTSGSKSAKVWSREVLGIIANGNMTLGKINMGAAQPTHALNYNESITTDANFSEPMVTRPDSIVFWAKFNPVSSSGLDSARMKASLHHYFNCKDPEDAASTENIVARGIVNFSTTNGWKRFSVPFVYEDGEFFNSFILVTFATNKTAGGGSANDQLWIDDVELIYNPDNPASIKENESLKISANYDNVSDQINFVSKTPLSGEFTVVNASGQLIQSGDVAPVVPFEGVAGMYILKVEANGKVFETKILKH